MHTEIICIFAFCAFWTVANSYVLAQVTRQMTEVAGFLDRKTFADIVDYEKQMAAIPDDVDPAAPESTSRVWDLMRRAHEEILRVRELETVPFSWTPEQCEDYWRSQELVFARQHPELDKNAYFDSMVDKLVVANMWAKAPKKEEPVLEMPDCVICGAPGVMRTTDAGYCQRHSALWNSQEPMTDPEPPAPVTTFPAGDCNATDGADFCDLPAGHGGPHSWAAPPPTSHDQDDAFRNMVLGKYE